MQYSLKLEVPVGAVLVAKASKQASHRNRTKQWASNWSSNPGFWIRLEAVRGHHDNSAKADLPAPVNKYMWNNKYIAHVYINDYSSEKGGELGTGEASKQSTAAML